MEKSKSIEQITKELSAEFDRSQINWMHQGQKSFIGTHTLETRKVWNPKIRNFEFKEKCKIQKTRVLAYITSRDVQNRLDEVVGAENWQSKTIPYGPVTICHLGIKFGKDWVWKSDGSEESRFSPEKGAISGALKRAAVLFGVGRYLYDYPNVKTELIWNDVFNQWVVYSISDTWKNYEQALIESEKRKEVTND